MWAKENIWGLWEYLTDWKPSNYNLPWEVLKEMFRKEFQPTKEEEMQQTLVDFQNALIDAEADLAKKIHIITQTVSYKKIKTNIANHRIRTIALLDISREWMAEQLKYQDNLLKSAQKMRQNIVFDD